MDRVILKFVEDPNHWGCGYCVFKDCTRCGDLPEGLECTETRREDHKEGHWEIEE